MLAEVPLAGLSLVNRTSLAAIRAGDTAAVGEFLVREDEAEGPRSSPALVGAQVTPRASAG